jgi:hypothetical protein
MSNIKTILRKRIAINAFHQISGATAATMIDTTIIQDPTGKISHVHWSLKSANKRTISQGNLTLNTLSYSNKTELYKAIATLVQKPKPTNTKLNVHLT